MGKGSLIELIYLLVCTHITIVCVTLFLHRGQAHLGIEFAKPLEHFMRFWLWLTTGMVTKEWVAVHRKHHQKTDVDGDPHSPHLFGIKTVLFKGAFLYRAATIDDNMVNSYGRGTPSDWMEHNVYTPHSRLGIILLLLLNLWIFGWIGALIWGIQMIWIPFWAAGVINGLGHWFGYRNTNTNDKSTNIVPFGILIGGEELHNNHHSAPANPKMSQKWWEIDIGWIWLSLFQKLRLAKIKER